MAIDIITPTHILDGVLLQQRTDNQGRTYYVSISTRARAKTRGLDPQPVTADILAEVDRLTDLSEAEVDDMLEKLGIGEVPEERRLKEDRPILTHVTLDAFGVIMQAYLAPGAHAERLGYVARRVKSNVIELSIPAPRGGHDRFLITLPDTFPVDAEPRE
jgi:hypothetical protein